MRGHQVAALAIAAMVGACTKASPSVEAGRWQTVATRKVNGGTSEVDRGLLCLKGDDATLERLVSPVEGRQDCKAGDQSQRDGIFRKSWTCPGLNGLPDQRIEIEVQYRKEGYDGIARILSKGAGGFTPSGETTLTGKRVGDC